MIELSESQYNASSEILDQLEFLNIRTTSVRPNRRTVKEFAKSKTIHCIDFSINSLTVQQKAVIQFTNDEESLSKSSPIPNGCPLTGA